MNNAYLFIYSVEMGVLCYMTFGIAHPIFHAREPFLDMKYIIGSAILLYTGFLILEVDRLENLHNRDWIR
jgi:hypothetical protein